MPRCSAKLESFFDVVLGADDVRRPKPDSQIYRLACTRLGARTGRSVALEDSPTGAAAARAAGPRVIVVPSVPGSVDADTLADSLSSPSVRRALFLR